MKATLLLSLGLIAALTPFFANAEEPKPPKRKYPVYKTMEEARPKIIRKNGQPLRIIWHDGKEAIVFIDRNPAFRGQTKANVVSNDCNEFDGMSCTLSVYIRYFSYQLIWTKHPDPKKIGQLVKTKQRPLDTTSYPRSTSENFTRLEKDLFPKIASKIPEDRIQCDDFRWLGTQNKDAPERLIVPRWFSESENGRNPETGAKEPRIEGGALDLELKRLDARTLLIGDAKEYISNNNYKSLYDSTLVLSLKDPKEEEGYCHVQLKLATDLDIFSGARKAAKKQFVPYIYGSDESFDGHRYVSRQMFDLATQDSEPNPETKQSENIYFELFTD